VTRDDPVTPALRRHVFERDRGCVLAVLAARGRMILTTPCRDRYGTPVDARFVVAGAADRILTLAHVRDRGKGGRMGKRPASTPRRTAAVCHGHHLIYPTIDQGFIRDAVDVYLEEQEGADVDRSSRPWEVIRRIRAAVD
jgi:hypothetical protein